MFRRFGFVLPILAVLACGRTVEVRPGDPGSAAPTADAWVESTLERLTLRQKVGQMVMPWVGGEYMAVESDAYDTLRTWVQQYGIGGVVVSIGPPLEVASKLNRLQRAAELPLLVAADMEHGPGQRLTAGTVLPYGMDLGSGTVFPPVMALGAAGDERLAYQLGRVTAQEARAVGVHVAFAPVVDVNNNPANPIINTRSYGAAPELVARLASAHIRGLQENGMLATAKHFPGHGDTGTDSHIALPVITVDKARADTVELVPFRAAVEAGVAGVMSAHIAFPDLTGDSVPATLSPELLNGLLREELGFDGLVFTDALNMGGIVKQYGEADAAVMAVKAGADVLLMPPDIPVAVDAVVDAVRRREIAEGRIDRSVRRLLRAKARMGLHRKRTVEVERVPEVVGSRSHVALAERAAERSITVARDEGRILPLDSLEARRVLSIVYTDDFDPLAGRLFQQELAERFPEVETAMVDSRTLQTVLDSLVVRADSADAVFFSPFVRVRAWKGDVAVAEPVAAFVETLAARRPTVVTAFGNPYVLGQFPEVGTYVLAWGQGDAAQQAAVEALTGEIPVVGRLPIPLPPYHPLGSGIRIERVAEGGGTE